uniref:Uncharacterized protein n=1 Tax=Romanomermis culicivorax TaxID=13658 RepID=A0A915IJV9_ROMCU
LSSKKCDALEKKVEHRNFFILFCLVCALKKCCTSCLSGNDLFQATEDNYFKYKIMINSQVY